MTARPHTAGPAVQDAAAYPQIHGLSYLAASGLSWDPWIGCNKVDTGCKNCILFDVLENPGHVRRAPIAEFEAPATMTTPRLYFVCGRSDFFHPTADPWRTEAWEVIRTTPQHTHLILTRRPDLIADRLPKGWPYNNCWLGVSVEDQRTSNKRIPALMNVPAKVRFIFVEPVLERVDVSPWLTAHDAALTSSKSCNCPRCFVVRGSEAPAGHPRGLDWVGVGGEFGVKCRPMDPAWATALETQCDATGTPFHFKQWGGYPDDRTAEKAVLNGRLRVELPLGDWDYLKAGNPR